MKRLKNILPKAIQAIDIKIKSHNDSVKKEYEGYFASFGASIIQSGLIPTLAFYSDGGDAERDTTEFRRNQFLQAIMYILDENSKKNLLEYVLEQVYTNFIYGNINYDFIRNKPDVKKMHKIQHDIIDASIALKLALRSYKLEK
jgi:CRISPR-associated protein Cmr5